MNENIKVRASVNWFAEKMEAKLKLNDNKGGWKDCEVDWLIERIKQEVTELESDWWKRKNDSGRSASEGFMFVATNEDIINECADIANFSMMIADMFGEDYGN